MSYSMSAQGDGKKVKEQIDTNIQSVKGYGLPEAELKMVEKAQEIINLAADNFRPAKPVTEGDPSPEMIVELYGHSTVASDYEDHNLTLKISTVTPSK